MLGDAKSEIKKSDEMWNDSNFIALRNQQEEDYGNWGPFEFKMPSGEGQWDSVTTNSPVILANKIMGILASSWLQLFIDVNDETRTERESISRTEQLANGAIWLADQQNIAVPSGKKLQQSLSFDAVVRGGTVKSVYWSEEDGECSCAIDVYDPLYSQWIEGMKELIWFCNRNSMKDDLFKYSFSKEIKNGKVPSGAKAEGKTLTYLFCDEETWRVAVGDSYIREVEHGLGYVPVHVRPTGTVPYRTSTKWQDTMKFAWQSYAMNTRNVYELESKLLSIETTKAIDSGRKDIIGAYDSTRSGGQKPAIEKLGYGTGQRNNMLLLDKAKGQEFHGIVEQPGNQVVDAFLSRVRHDMDVVATISGAAYGDMTRSGSGALAAELRSAALEFMSPFRDCVQEDMKWVAYECVKQFKNGQFNKISMEGRDRKREKFYADLEPKDIELKRFDCELVADKLRDELQELGAAIQKVTYGLSSRKTAMVKHNIVEDPDKEFDKMDEEKAAEDPVLQYDKLAKYFKDQGGEIGDRYALYYEALSAITIESTVRKAMEASLIPPQVPGEGEIKPSTISPQMSAANLAAQPRNANLAARPRNEVM